MSSERRRSTADADGVLLRAVPSWTALAGALVLTAAVGALDWVTGPEIAFAIFYIPGVALAAWNGGRQRGLALAVVSAAVWYAADRGAGAVYSEPFISIWNAGVRMAIFALFAVVLTEMRAATARAVAAGASDSEAGGTPPAEFYARVEMEYSSTARGGPPFTLAYIDLGGAADGGLEPAVAERAIVALRRVLRSHDLVARPRDREMAVFLPDTPPEVVPAILERLGHAALTAAVGEAVVVGAASCRHPSPELNQVIQHAYQLMYTAERHRGQVVVAHETAGTPEAHAGLVPATPSAAG